MQEFPSIPDQLLLPFTEKEDMQEPIIINGGDGPYLHTTDGRKLFDGNSSLWVANLGHRHPDITAAIHTQLDQLAHTSLYSQAHTRSIELTERLPHFAGLDGYYSFFCNSGSEAVETSLKLTLDYWRRIGKSERTRIITLQNSYHGETSGAMSVNGGAEYQHYQQFRPYRTEIVASLATTESEKHLQREKYPSISETIENGVDNIAAIIIEPLHGAGGIVPVPQEELAAIQQICDQSGCLLIIDEVATGFYRAGSRFHYQDHDLRPDMLLLGKGMSAGYIPFASVLIHPKIGDQYARSRGCVPVMHGHTFSGNPLACAAALKNMDVLSTRQMQEQIRTLQIVFGASLHNAFKGEPRINVRHRGLIAGIEIISPTFTDDMAMIASETCQLLKRSSILTRSIGNTVILAPPYVSTPEQIRGCVEATLASLQSVLHCHEF